MKFNWSDGISTLLTFLQLLWRHLFASQDKMYTFCTFPRFQSRCRLCSVYSMFFFPLAKHYYRLSNLLLFCPLDKSSKYYLIVQMICCECISLYSFNDSFERLGYQKELLEHIKVIITHVPEGMFDLISKYWEVRWKTWQLPSFLTNVEIFENQIKRDIQVFHKASSQDHI